MATHTKRHATSLALREAVKAPPSRCHTPIGTAKMSNSDTTKWHWQLLKGSIAQRHTSAAMLLGAHPGEVKTYVHSNPVRDRSQQLDS